MTPTERARRSDALYYDTESVARRCLCDMIANRESDLEELRAENDGLRNDADLLRAMLSQVQTEKRCYVAENAKLRKLVADMREAFIHGNCYRWCKFKEPCDGKCQYIDRMRELGVDE